MYNPFLRNPHKFSELPFAPKDTANEELLEKTINDIGYTLYDVEYAKEGQNYFLRIFIDKDGGIDLNDCEKVNNVITDILDEADPIKEQYFLEVSSPGIERVIRKEKHLKENVGNEIEVSLFTAIDGKKQLVGILQNYDNENINIIVDEKEIIIPRKSISLMKTVYNWE